MGNIEDKILGIVHGVMPAIGAAATYKRMRCGFEYAGPMSYIASAVVGNVGKEVTAVLANSPGGLELLPSQAYGNGWLQIKHGKKTILSLPKQGDPYEEIYKTRGKWYGLFRDDWTNPAKLKNRGSHKSFEYADLAKNFHSVIVNTYHKQSYCHYGADPAHPAWHRVVWEIEDSSAVSHVDALKILKDDMQGHLELIDMNGKIRISSSGIKVKLLPAADPGDQTVPLHSAEHQLLSGRFKGIFRQVGYEHQESYHNNAALHSTLYCLVRIAQTMTWSKA